MKTAKKAGIKTKDSQPKRQKYILPTPPMSRKTLPAHFGSEKPIYEEDMAGRNTLVYDNVNFFPFFFFLFWTNFYWFCAVKVLFYKIS